MQKIYLGIIAAVAAGIVYTLVTSFATPTGPEPTLFISVEKTTVVYGDIENWSVKGLPHYAPYETRIEWPGHVVITNGSADFRGEASGCFLVTEDIPAGTFTFRFALASNPEKYSEVSINVLHGEGSIEPASDIIVVSVVKDTVRYGERENWGVKGLPPNADYETRIGWPGHVAIIDKGNANADGVACGSFLVVEEIPARTVSFRVALASDPDKFGEVSINVVP
ncbi:MAG: hypothetical protein ACE5J2_08635 [Nitrososphaerales archaeon]